MLSYNCWAHARRYFDRALNNDQTRTTYAIKQIGLLYEVERKADDEQMNHEQRKELRLRLAVPILHTFDTWLKNEAAKVLLKRPIGKAIHYILEHYDRLCRYIVDGRYKIDINIVENGQRPVALSRKTIFSARIMMLQSELLLSTHFSAAERFMKLMCIHGLKMS